MRLWRVSAAVAVQGVGWWLWVRGDQYDRGILTGGDGTCDAISALIQWGLALVVFMISGLILFGKITASGFWVFGSMVLGIETHSKADSTRDPSARLNTTPRLIHRSEDGLIDW